MLYSTSCSRATSSCPTARVVRPIPRRRACSTTSLSSTTLPRSTSSISSCSISSTTRASAIDTAPSVPIISLLRSDCFSHQRANTKKKKFLTRGYMSAAKMSTRGAANRPAVTAHSPGSPAGTTGGISGGTTVVHTAGATSASPPGASASMAATVQKVVGTGHGLVPSGSPVATQGNSAGPTVTTIKAPSTQQFVHGISSPPVFKMYVVFFFFRIKDWDVTVSLFPSFPLPPEQKEACQPQRAGA